MNHRTTLRPSMPRIRWKNASWSLRLFWSSQFFKVSHSSCQILARGYEHSRAFWATQISLLRIRSIVQVQTLTLEESSFFRISAKNASKGLTFPRRNLVEQYWELELLKQESNLWLFSWRQGKTYRTFDVCRVCIVHLMRTLWSRNCHDCPWDAYSTRIPTPWWCVFRS